MPERTDWPVVAICCLIHAVTIGGGYMSGPPLFPVVVHETHWNIASLGTAWSLIPLGSLPPALLAGVAINRFGRAPILIGSAAASAAAICARAYATTEIEFQLSFLAYGMTSGFLYVSLTDLATASASRKLTETVQAIFLASYALGCAIAFSGSEALRITFGGWRGVFFTWGLLSFAASLPAVFARRRSVMQAGERSTSPVLRAPHPAIYLYGLAYALYVGAYLGLEGILPYVLVHWGFSAQIVNLSLAGSALGFVVGAAIWSQLAKFAGAAWSLYLLAMILALISIILLILTSSSGMGWLIGLLVFCLGLQGGAIALLFPLLIKDPRAGGANVAANIGLVIAASYLGGFLGPLAASALLEIEPKIAVLAMAVCFPVGALFLPNARAQ